MAKVYVVTRGEDYKYRIDCVFSNREAAEKYCAVYADIFDEPKIEEYDLEDGTNIDVDHVYKAIDFEMVKRRFSDRISLDWEMKYYSKPIKEKIFLKGYTTSRDGTQIELHRGVIPVDKTVKTGDQAEKLVHDYIANWKMKKGETK